MRSGRHGVTRHLTDWSSSDGDEQSWQTQQRPAREIPLSDMGSSCSEREDEFATVDWNHDTHEARKSRHVLQREIQKSTALQGLLYYIYNVTQGWTVLFFVAISTALLAACIHIAVEWMGDLKFGICTESLALSKRLCCMDYAGRACSSWKRWSELVKIEEETKPYFDYFCYVTAACLFASLCAFIVREVGPKAAGSGIPEVKTILGGFSMKHDVLGGFTLIVKSVGLVLSVATGLNLGKEGPMVHLACCWANIYASVLPKYRSNEALKREVISASAAAGVAVAFGAPLGGVLFSLEEVSTYFPHKTMWRAFFCAIIACAALQYTDPFSTGQLVQFQVSYHTQWHWFELLLFAFLGCLGGIIGSLFIELNLKMASLRKRFVTSQDHVIEATVVTLITSCINYTNVFLRGSSTTLLENLFGQCSEETIPNEHANISADLLCDLSDVEYVLLMLLLAAVAKFALTVVTFGVKVPSGLFIPSLCVGALLGRVVGVSMQVWQRHSSHVALFDVCKGLTTHCINPGIYAMVGAAAMLCGVTRMTVSLAVIMFELTGGLEYILPIMVSVMFAKWMASMFGSDGIYDRYIHFNGYPYFDHRTDITTPAIAREVKSREPLCYLSASGMTIGDIADLLSSTSFKGFPLVVSPRDMIVLGFVSRTHLLQGIEKAQRHLASRDTAIFFGHAVERRYESPDFVDFGPYVYECPIQVTERTSLDRISDIFKGLGVRYCLVTNVGRLSGIITKKDILVFLHRQNQL